MDLSNKKEPLMVSIECTVFNHAPYLRKCLDGFVMQKTNFRYEAIVHDDASTDDSVAIIKEYASRYPDIIKPIFEKENQFSKDLIAFRRIISAHLTGKYIAICEGDDYWTDPLKLQKQVSYLESHDSVNICVHNAMRMYSDGKRDLFNKDIESGVFDLRKSLHMGWFTPTASFLYRNNIGFNPLWFENGSNGDMAVLYSNLLKGDLFYSSEIMSVYNYGTPYSMSSSTPRTQLYKKKRGMLKTINQLSQNKYFIHTYPLIALTYIKQAVWWVLKKVHVKS